MQEDQTPENGPLEADDTVVKREEREADTDVTRDIQRRETRVLLKLLLSLPRTSTL